MEGSGVSKHVGLFGLNNHNSISLDGMVVSFLLTNHVLRSASIMAIQEFSSESPGPLFALCFSRAASKQMMTGRWCVPVCCVWGRFFLFFRVFQSCYDSNRKGIIILLIMLLYLARVKYFSR